MISLRVGPAAAIDPVARVNLAYFEKGEGVGGRSNQTSSRWPVGI